MSEQQIALRKAARELMDASDYLTEKVQRFSVEGDIRYVSDYFSEAFEANHREDALRRMSEGNGSDAAMTALQHAMDDSVLLMKREYYAMKLVIDAKEYTDYPEVLKSMELSEEDSSLRPKAKMELAALMVHDSDYYGQKQKIRDNMLVCLDELEKMAYDTDASALHALSDELFLERIAIILETIGIFFMVWLTSRLGIHPVLNAVERIQSDSPIPEVGANEFRYLARAYNKMYEVYKNSLDHLNFKASHDELTGAYNRSGYDLLLSSIEMANTYMLLFDIDNFKEINDTYGHETGDRVLVKLVRTLKENFRSDDYICRIGGDEFVVFMVHSTEKQQRLISQKIEQINHELVNTADSLPPVSVSVGIVHGSEAENAQALFEKTDAAMYQSKRHGKHTYTFNDASNVNR
ncbi:MAG: GGDEF domain-containing protein [Clostridia bacterium]|nr:GGDEF domain-containing protein [Clostridia bacterium]